MSNEMQQITPFDGYGSDMVEYTPNQAMARPMGGPAEMPAQTGLVKKIHHSLRGRYLVGMILGTVLGGFAGYFGYRSQQPIYRAEAMVQIAHAIRPVDIRATADTVLPDFEEYLQSQAMMISSRTIVDAAMNSDMWRAKGLSENPDYRLTIANNLTVEHPSRTELIRVYYTDKNAEIAGNVIQAIVDAYKNDAYKRSQLADSKRIGVLQSRLEVLYRQINGFNDDINKIANTFGTGDLGPLVEAKLNEELKLEQRLHETQFALDAARRKKDAKQAVYDLNPDQIAMVDQTMRQRIAERDQVIYDIKRLETAGRLPEDRQLKQLNAMLEVLQNKITEYAVNWRDMQMKMSDDPSINTAGGIPRIMQLSEKVLEGEVEALTKRLKDVKDERTEMGRQMIKMQNLQRDREDAVKDRLETNARITQLIMENSMGSRMTVLNPGDAPIVPYKDRRKMFCAAGVLGGFGLPLGILALLGLMDKRYRYSDETNDGVSNVPLLGILPRLPDKLSDPEQAAVAAHCIHQIRIMLQVGQNPDRRRTFMVTSASTGDGKTSLTMALGLSFAASGSKTLVIDCDMVGQGLTHRLKAHGVPGLIETLNIGTLRGHVRKTGTKGLYILPIGNADAVHAGVLSPQSIKRLMSACREHFDVVVIDTGPILGSLEASVVATEADGVIVAVARGQQQPLVEKAIKHLRSVGANIFGIVFNRAEERDFQRSVASASIRSVSAHQNEPRSLLPDTDESARFGPLARSVASCLPAASSQNSNGNGNGHGDASV